MDVFVREIGEFGLIDRLTALVDRPDARVLVGVGDDAALVQCSDSALLTTDALVDGIHFRDDLIDPQSLGYKALAVSLSDVAAMGGIPSHVLVTICVPRDEQVEWLEALYRGIGEACSLFGVSVVGGDVVSTPGPRTIVVAAMGRLAGERPLLRSGARVGDLVFVTGDLGGAAAYLDLIERGGHLPSPLDRAELQTRHTRPEPQLVAGRLLARVDGCTSLNDISDGLSAELHELAAASGVRLEIDADRVPVARAVRHFSRLMGEDALRYALHGGEDYQLVGTVSPLSVGTVMPAMEAAGVRFTLIGEAADGNGEVAIRTPAGVRDLSRKGYDHFFAR